MKIKICGVTTPEDALMSVEEGADLVGLIFAESPRRIDAKTARRIVAALPAGVQAVGVFRNQPLDAVRAAIAESGVAIAQLHGNESPAYAAALGLPVIKTLTAGIEAGAYDAFAFLIDPPKAKPPCCLPKDRLLVAGELTADGVGDVIRRYRPLGVDVCGATESQPGRKDRVRIRAFVRAVREAGAP